MPLSIRRRFSSWAAKNDFLKREQARKAREEQEQRAKIWVDYRIACLLCSAEGKDACEEPNCPRRPRAVSG